MAQAVRTLGVIAAVLFAAAPHIQAVAVDDGPQTFTYAENTARGCRDGVCVKLLATASNATAR